MDKYNIFNAEKRTSTFRLFSYCLIKFIFILLFIDSCLKIAFQDIIQIKHNFDL